MKNTRCFVDLSNLPRIKENGIRISWEKSVGYKVPFVYNDIKGEIEILEYLYQNKYPKVNVRYKNKIIEMPTYMIANCNLGNLLGTKTSDYKFEIGSRIKDEKRDLTIIDTKNIYKNDRNFKSYKYHCNICNFDCGNHWSIANNCHKDELWISEIDLIKGKGCSCCSSHIVVSGINDIPTTAPWMVDYFQGGEEEAKLYTSNSGKKILHKCPDCNSISSKEYTICGLNENKGFSCICKDGISYPNKFMYNLLKQLNLNFEREYCPDWIDGKLYDFYLYDLNIIIEMDGGFHFCDNTINGQTKSERQEIDRYKDKMAKEHDITVIRINCHYDMNNRFEYVKNNVISNLKNIIDLDKVDWLECDKFALSNLVKEACRIKKENPNFTTGQISEILDVHYGTISKWLKIGNNLGLCTYEKNIENKNRIKLVTQSSKKSCSKQVEVFKDGVSYGIFVSISELSRKSESIFGVKFLTSCISSVCRGKEKTHKGYTFKYIENET